MRSISASVIVQHTMDEAASDCYEPTVDRRWAAKAIQTVKPMSSYEALASARFHRVPVMLGTTARDGLGKIELEHTIFESSDVTSMSELEALLKREFGPLKDEALGHYQKLSNKRARIGKGRAAKTVDVDKVLGYLSNDLWYYASTHFMADLLARAPEPPPVFLYNFGALRRSLHGFDAMYWRGAAESATSTKMAAYLGNFARNGSPNGDGLPRWEAHASGSGRYMELGPKLGMNELSEDDKERHEFLAREYFSKRALSEVQRGEKLLVIETAAL